jgi:hypothetical protein
MTMPTVAIVTTNLDAGTDSPATARSDLLDAVQKLNQIIAHISTFVGTLLDDTTAAAARITIGIGQAYQVWSASAGRTTDGIFASFTSNASKGSGGNVSTGIYTVPQTGLYQLTATFLVTGTASANGMNQCYLGYGSSGFGPAKNINCLSGSALVQHTTISFLWFLTAADQINAYVNIDAFASGMTGTTVTCLAFAANLVAD